MALSAIHQEVLGLAFTLIGALVLFVFRPKVRLVFGRANNSLNSITVPDQHEDGEHRTTEIYVEKFFLQNTGRVAATNVEFVLSEFPADVRIWQPRDSEIKLVEKSNCFIRLPQVAPRELVIIDCVYLNQRAASVVSVKCAETLGKEVAFFTVRRFPPTVYAAMWILLVFGVAFIFQLLFKLI
ncbi:MAG: hypothetical protein AAF625_01710 [Pseudomonadota bacterium]